MSLPFPKEVIEQHAVLLGKTGSGKSSKLRLIVEHLLDHKKRVCVVDPKGDWWGLKSGADGDSAGYKVMMLGDFVNAQASDIMLNAQGGRQIAELVADGNRPAVIGFRGWYTSDMVQFWIDFAAGIFAKNRGEFYLVIDECHNFAPKGKIMDPQAGKCLHWSNRLLSEGRGLGIVCLLASQRPQKVHNDTLTSCESLFALRMVHASDRRAVQDWIEGCGDMTLGQMVLNSLAGIKREEGYVWCPSAEFGPKKIVFPMFTTFDSFAPPQLQKQVFTASWADVDLSAVNEKLASIVQEAKANDPRELKREIAELKRKLASAEQKAPEVKHSEIPVLTPEDRRKIESALSTCQSVVDAIEKHSVKVQQSITDMREFLAPIETKLSVIVRNGDRAALERTKPALMGEVRKIIHAPKTEALLRQVDVNNTLSRMARAFLTILAQYEPNNLTKSRILALTEYASSGPVSKCFADLVREGYARPGIGSSLAITEAGLTALGSWEPLPIGEELRKNVLSGNRLSTMEKEFIRILFGIYPDSISKAELLSRTGYASSGPVSAAFARLVRLEFAVSDGPTLLKAHDNFFK